MLLQRLDVTLESLFLRSEGQSLESDSGKKNSDIVTVILAQREHLSEYPVAYSVRTVHKPCHGTSYDV